MDKPKKPRWDIIGLTFALNGLRHVFIRERNLKIHIVITILVVIAAIVFSISTTEIIILVITVSNVIFAEIVNTAIETVVDLICIDILKDELRSNEYNAKAKIAKDVAAGAVFVTAIMSIIVGVIVFLPKIINIVASNK